MLDELTSSDYGRLKWFYKSQFKDHLLKDRCAGSQQKFTMLWERLRDKDRLMKEYYQEYLEHMKRITP